MICKNVLLIAGLLALTITLRPALGKPDAMQNIKSGTWGGQGINLIVENDSGTLEYDCAHGTIGGPLKVDSNGRFVLSGMHVREHGGPIREGVGHRGSAVSYTGWTDGKRMTLQVTLTDSKEDVGNYELEYGRDGRVRKCK